MKKRIALGALVLAGCTFLPATALADYGGNMPGKKAAKPHKSHAKHHARHAGANR